MLTNTEYKKHVHVKEHVFEVVLATAALIGNMCVSVKEEQEHLEKCIDGISEQAAITF